MLIYVEQISERIIYTFNFVFHERDLMYNLTNDWKYFENEKGPKFVYANVSSENYVKIVPSSLLFDENIQTYQVEKGSFQNSIECIQFDGITDVFASIFYVLTRYEEYLSKAKDVHDRFPSKESFQVKNKWIQLAICDRWSEQILSFIYKNLQINLVLEQEPTSIIPTFDIDNTFAFKWKKGWRKYLSILKDKYKKDLLRIQARKDFYDGKIEDPYDSYDYILTIKNQGFDVKLFWLLGEYARYDKNLSVNDIRHQRHIRYLSKLLEIGLHPSYKSNENNLKLSIEKNNLEKITGQSITISRQHFLKLNLPFTYQNLIQHGFKEDYTMGYPDEVGFRAGTARPFYFFDLTLNQKTDLIIHPFVYMDGTLNEYKNWTPDQAMQIISELFKEVKRYGGDFVFLWHNETITDFGKWKNWRQVLEYTLKLNGNSI